MTSPPTKQGLISLVESMCEVQDRMFCARGMPEHIQRPHVDNMEALKAPVFFLWEQLGYGTPRGSSRNTQALPAQPTAATGSMWSGSNSPSMSADRDTTSMALMITSIRCVKAISP